MLNYNQIIKKNFRKKFQNSTISNKEFLKSFFLQRKKILKKINLIKKKKRESKNDDTLRKIKNFNKKKNYNNINIIEYYKKFEINLKLKKKYNKYFKKKTNHETSISTYAYLGICILNNKFLNFLQKINCIIKIIDKISLKIFQIDIETAIVLKKLIKEENCLIKKIIK
jgi:hypothetical protein